MSEEHLENEQNEQNQEEHNPFENNEVDERIIPVSGLYESWFLDYASYVILERAVPGLADGLKPVQRRILHSMKEIEDGRYNKVANIIGNTMKYHPHGDASIGDALVQLGQKDLLIDCQGNWGNTLTGDGAAAAEPQCSVPLSSSQFSALWLKLKAEASIVIMPQCRCIV